MLAMGDKMVKNKKSKDIFRHSEHPYDFVEKGITHFTKYLVKFLVKTSLTPNQITFISFILSLVAALLFSFGRYNYQVIAGILVLFSFYLDYCDGPVARLKNMTSVYGAWFDSITDRVGLYSIIMGITIGIYVQTHNTLSWIVGMLTISVYAISDFFYTGHQYWSSITQKLFKKNKINTQSILKKLYNFSREYLGNGSRILLICVASFIPIQFRSFLGNLNVMFMVLLFIILTISAQLLGSFVVCFKNRFESKKDE